MKFGEWAAPEWKRDQFSYMVKEAFVTPKLTEEGTVEVQVCDFVCAAEYADEGDLGSEQAASWPVH